MTTAVNTKTLVLYHANCFDGFCAAWVLTLAFGQSQIEAVPMSYGQDPPDVTGRLVFIVDFSFKRPVMEKLIRDSVSLVVLDHHKTAEAELAGLSRPSDGVEIIFDMNKSGGRLTWEYCFGDSPSPWLVDYTEDRDLWRHALPDSEHVNAGLRSYTPSFDLWDTFRPREMRDAMLRDGVAIRRAEQQIVTQHVHNARMVTFAGHLVPCVNATVQGLYSEIAGALAVGQPFGMCYFDRKDGKRQWSLRSDENGIDVSALAKDFGGGGHVHAAGFETIAPQPRMGDVLFDLSDMVEGVIRDILQRGSDEP